MIARKRKMKEEHIKLVRIDKWAEKEKVGNIWWKAKWVVGAHIKQFFS